MPTGEGATRRCCCDRGGRIMPSWARLKSSCREHHLAAESHLLLLWKEKGCGQTWTSQWLPPIASFTPPQTCTWESPPGWVSITQGEQMSKLCWEAASKLWNRFPWNRSLNSEHVLKTPGSGKDLNVCECPCCLRHATSMYSSRSWAQV